MTRNIFSNLLIQDQGPLFEHKQLISVGSTEECIYYKGNLVVVRKAFDGRPLQNWLV